MELDVIYNEDCIEGMKKIPSNSIDMILCDLPYGITQNKWDIVIPLDIYRHLGYELDSEYYKVANNRILNHELGYTE